MESMTSVEIATWVMAAIMAVQLAAAVFIAFEARRWNKRELVNNLSYLISGGVTYGLASGDTFYFETSVTNAGNTPSILVHSPYGYRWIRGSDKDLVVEHVETDLKSKVENSLIGPNQTRKATHMHKFSFEEMLSKEKTGESLVLHVLLIYKDTIGSVRSQTYAFKITPNPGDSRFNKFSDAIAYVKDFHERAKDDPSAQWDQKDANFFVAVPFPVSMYLDQKPIKDELEATEKDIDKLWD